MKVTWLFNISTYKFSLSAYTYGADPYLAKIIPESFSGVKLRVDLESKLYAPNEMEFDISNADGALSESDVEGEFCCLYLLLDDVLLRQWCFIIETAVEAYGKIHCTCVDPVKAELEGDFPNTPTLTANFPSDQVPEDKEYLVPRTMGTAFIPCMPFLHSSENYYALGKTTSGYTIIKVRSPRRWDFVTEWDDSYTYDQASLSGEIMDVRGVQLEIADSDGDGTVDAYGVWTKNGTMLAPLIQFEGPRPSVINPGEWIYYLLQDFGLSSGDLNQTSFNTVDTALAAAEWGGGWWKAESKESILSNLLSCCDCFLSADNYVNIHLFSKTSTETFSRDTVKNLSFSPSRFTKSDVDGAKVKFVWDGEPQDEMTGEATVPLYGAQSSIDNPSSEALEYKFGYNNAEAQKFGILWAQKKFDKKYTVRFSTVLSEVTSRETIIPGKVITLEDPDNLGIVRGSSDFASWCSASSEYALGGGGGVITWSADKAFNGTNEDGYDCWRTTLNADTDWLEIAFPKSIELTAFRIQARNASSSYPPKTVSFRGSNDGFSSYDELYSGISPKLSQSVWSDWIELSATGVYDEYRLYIIDGYSGGTEYIAIGQIEFKKQYPSMYGDSKSVVMTSIHIKPDLETDIEGVVYNHLEEYADLSPSAITPDTSGDTDFEFKSISKIVVVTGGTVFHYQSGESVPDETSVVLSADLFGGLTTYDWEYWNGSAWANLSGTQTAQTYTLAYNNAAWSGDTLRLRCLSGDYYDEITVYKVYDGAEGEAGAAGETGATGPGNVYIGEYVASSPGNGEWTWPHVFYNNENRRDLVKYSGSYYIFNGVDGNNETSWIVGNWEAFGATYTSVATDILLAQDVTITRSITFSGYGDGSYLNILGSEGLIINAAGGLKVNGGADISLISTFSGSSNPSLIKWYRDTQVIASIGASYANQTLNLYPRASNSNAFRVGYNDDGTSQPFSDIRLNAYGEILLNATSGFVKLTPSTYAEITAGSYAAISAGTGDITLRTVATGKSVKPYTNNYTDLGTSSVKFKNGYFSGNLNAGALVLTSSITGVTSISMNGALTGVTRVDASSNVNVGGLLYLDGAFKLLCFSSASNTGWRIGVNGTDLEFRYDGALKASLDTSGNLNIAGSYT